MTIALTTTYQLLYLTMMKVHFLKKPGYLNVLAARLRCRHHRPGALVARFGPSAPRPASLSSGSPATPRRPAFPLAARSGRGRSTATTRSIPRLLSAARARTPAMPSCPGPSERAGRQAGLSTEPSCAALMAAIRGATRAAPSPEAPRIWERETAATSK